jgi:LssY C-terminus
MMTPTRTRRSWVIWTTFWLIVCAFVVCCSTPAAAQLANSGARFTDRSAILNPLTPSLAAIPLATPAASTAQPISNPGTFTAAAPSASPVSLEIMAKIPRRVLSAKGHPGDVTNFLLIGNKRDMKKAMDAAGWDTVSSTKFGVIWRDLFESLYAKAYRGIPMTKFYLFDRQQDFGYAHSRGLLSVRNRHHFRIWRAPFDVDGQTVWVGAATHDVGLQHLGHFLHLIHKIDPDVDAERQFVANTLIKTGRVLARGYITAPNAVTRARTVEGEDFYSDGRTLVMQLVIVGKSKPAAPEALPSASASAASRQDFVKGAGELSVESRTLPSAPALDR